MKRPALPHDIDAYIARQPLEPAVLLVRAARHWYYNTDEPILSDDQFDALIERVESFDPRHPVLREVGATPVGGAGRPVKVRLPYRMPSLGKIKPDRGATEWLAKQTWVVASDKLDGISALHNNVDPPQLLTRGGDVAGQDISARIATTRKLGHAPGVAVRGELIFLHSTFARHFRDTPVNNKVYKNPRNLMSGVVNTARDHPAAAHAVFIAYEQLHPPVPLIRAAAGLRAAGYAVVPHHRFVRPTLADIVAYHTERKRDALYEIDGLVLEGADGTKVAFKMDALPVRVTVDRILWRLSQFGVWRPTVRLTRSVHIGGVDITNLTGHNARRLLEWGIGPGAVIEIIRSGDVIPKIVGTVKRATPNWPPASKWDAGRVNIVPKQLDSAQARSAQVRRMETGLRVLGIEGIRETSVDKLYGVGITSLPALFAADAATIAAAGVGDVFTRKLVGALAATARTATHAQLMQASGVWPSGFTTTRFAPINARLPYARLIRADRTKLVAAVARAPGWSAATARVFVEHLDAYDAWMQQLPFVPRDARAVTASGPLVGCTWVFTKVRDKALQALIVEHGGAVGNSVTRTTTACVSAGPSDKTRRAESLGVPVVSLDAARADVAARIARGRVTPLT